MNILKSLTSALSTATKLLPQAPVTPPASERAAPVASNIGTSGVSSFSGAGDTNPNGILSQYTPTGASADTAAADGLAPGISASRKMAQTDLPSLQKYKADFEAVGAKYGLPPALLAAVASRESRAGNALVDGRGDHGNGFGLMQIDVRYHDTVGGPFSRENIDQGAALLKSNLGEIQRSHPDWTPAQQMRGAVAAYNFGTGNVHTLAGLDEGTTNNDYSTDVWARAQALAPSFGGAATPTSSTSTPASSTPTSSTPATPGTLPSAAVGMGTTLDTSGATVLKQGSEGSTVALLQKQLTQAGFDTGGTDSKFGPKTEAAVKAFQQAKGLVADGVAGPLTLDALNKATAPAPTTTTPGTPTTWTAAPSLEDVSKGNGTFKQGQQGDGVKQLQQLLGVEADGKFGEGTKSAVTAFQKANGLTPPPGMEGQVGKTTLDALKKAAASNTSGGQIRLPLMKQGDAVSDKVADVGCGITSVAMTIKGLTGKNVSPDSIYNQYGFGLETALQSEGVRTINHSNMREGDMGTEDQAWQVFQKATNAGHPVIYGANGPEFSHTGRGHVMVCTGTSVENGTRMYSFNDPATGTSRKLPFHELYTAAQYPLKQGGNFVIECAK